MTFVLILMLNIGSPGFAVSTAEFDNLQACERAAQSVIKKQPHSANDYLCLRKTTGLPE